MSLCHAPFWLRERQATLTHTLRTDPVSREQQQVPLCRCGREAHLVPLDPDLAIALTCSRFGIDRFDLLSPRRAERFVVARAFLVWALRSLGRPLSYPAIGRVLGQRHHTTIIHLHQKAIWLRLSDKFFRARCEALADRFYQLREHI